MAGCIAACTAAFPSAPTGFLNDPDGSKYHSACELIASCVTQGINYNLTAGYDVVRE